LYGCFSSRFYEVFRTLISHSVSGQETRLTHQDSAVQFVTFDLQVDLLNQTQLDLLPDGLLNALYTHTHTHTHTGFERFERLKTGSA